MLVRRAGGTTLCLQKHLNYVNWGKRVMKFFFGVFFFFNRGYKQVYGHLRIKEANLVKEIQKQGYRFWNVGKWILREEEEYKGPGFINKKMLVPEINAMNGSLLWTVLNISITKMSSMRIHGERNLLLRSVISDEGCFWKAKLAWYVYIFFHEKWFTFGLTVGVQKLWGLLESFQILLPLWQIQNYFASLNFGMRNILETLKLGRTSKGGPFFSFLVSIGTKHFRRV